MPNGKAAASPGAGARRRFRPRLLPTLCTAVAITLFVAAGGWQRGRMHGKEALAARFDAVAQAVPVPVPDLGAGGDWSARRFMPVVARGEFDAARQVYIDNKIQAGRVGYHVVAPLRLADGRVVLVDRGWIGMGASRAQLPSAPPPEGEVGIVGRLNLPDAYLELKPGTDVGAVRQNLDPARFAQATGLPVLPVFVEQTQAPVPDDGLVRAWARPDFGIEKHRLYMLQWYAFAALAIALWLSLNWRREAPADVR